MNRVVESDRYAGSRGVASRVPDSSGGGNVDDILKRLGALEVSVNDIRAQVSALTAVVPHLATKAEVNALRGELRADMHSMESSLIKWIVGTAIASVAVASAIASVVAKFVS